MHILVVEDEVALCDTIVRSLSVLLTVLIIAMTVKRH